MDLQRSMTEARLSTSDRFASRLSYVRLRGLRNIAVLLLTTALLSFELRRCSKDSARDLRCAVQFVEEQFSRVYGGLVEQVHVCYDTRELDKRVEEYRTAFTALQDLLDDLISQDKRHRTIKRPKVQLSLHTSCPYPALDILPGIPRISNLYHSFLYYCVVSSMPLFARPALHNLIFHV